MSRLGTKLVLHVLHSPRCMQFVTQAGTSAVKNGHCDIPKGLLCSDQVVFYWIFFDL